MELQSDVVRLGTLASQGDVSGVLTLLCQIVPTFQPDTGLRSMMRPQPRARRPARSRRSLRGAAPSDLAIASAGS
jgi:hypothetical protein